MQWLLNFWKCYYFNVFYNYNLYVFEKCLAYGASAEQVRKDQVS